MSELQNTSSEVNSDVTAAEENDASIQLDESGFPTEIPQSPAFTPPQMPQVDPAAIQNTAAQVTQAVQAGMNSNFTGGPLPQVDPANREDVNLRELGSETGAALVGGTADAVESVGQVADLTGDSLRVGLNNIRGKPTNPEDDPWNEGYQSGTWFDIPDEWVPENKTGYGKIARGLVEFGVLALTTKGIGKVATGAVGVQRAANVANKTNKWVRFAQISGEGAIADFVQSGWEQNLANLFREHAPGMLPTLMNALAVNEGDNQWLARLKTTLIGSGFNHLAHGIGGLIKGKQAANAAKKAGLSDYEVDRAGNEAMDAYIKAQVALDEKAGLENAADNFAAGKGVSRSPRKTEYNYTHGTEDEVLELSDAATKAERRQQLQDIIAERGRAAGDEWDELRQTSPSQTAANANRKPDPFVNPEQFDNVEKGIYRPEPDSVRTHLREMIADMKEGGDGRSYTPYATESAIKAMSAGNKTYREWVKETLDDITDSVFAGMDDGLSWKEVQEAIVLKATPILDTINAYADGKKVDLKNLFTKQLNDPKNYRVYADEVIGADGKFVQHKIRTITPIQKGVNIIGIHALTRLSSDIATGAVQIADGLPIGRQVDMLLEASKRAMIENKKLSLMWALDGRSQQAGFEFTTPLQKAYTAQLDEITKEYNQYFDWLHKLSKEGNHELRTKIAILHQMSDGKIRSMDQMHEWFKKSVWGGRMDRDNIKGQVWEEAVGTLYNSILSAPITPIKAITSTNLYAITRPFVVAMSANMPWRKNPQEAIIAAAQIDAMGRSFSDSLKMFKYNLDLGNARKKQSYTGKFDLESKIDDYKSRGPYIQQLGTPSEKLSYAFADMWTNINNHPWVAYSRIYMGAGDAAARTMSGRFRMAEKTARSALEQGIDPDDLINFVRKYEEGFRYGPEGVFKKDKYGFDVVNDLKAKLAGDKAALTSDLEGNAKVLQGLQEVPFMRNFFSFMRTGVNYLGREWVENMPAVARLQDKWKDLVRDTPRNLDLYGLKPEEVQAEVLLMKGNLDISKAIIGATVVATLSGRYRGSMPLDAEERDHWKRRDIIPNSFNIGGIQFGLKRLELFQPVMSMTANVVSNAHLLGEDIVDRTLQKASWIGATLIVDQSMLSGVEDLASILDPESAGNKTSWTAARIARSWMPVAGLSGAVGAIYDDAQKHAQSIEEMIFARDVWAKKNIPNKYDIHAKDRSGRPLVYGPENLILKLFNGISPMVIVPIDNDPVKIMLHEMRFDVPETTSRYKEEPLTSLEKSALEKAMAMDVQFRQELEDIARPDGHFMKSFRAYQKGGLKIQENKFRQKLPGGDKAKEGYKLSDQDWYREVQLIHVDAKNRAMDKILEDYPDLRRRVDIRLEKKVIGQTGDYGAIDEIRNFYDPSRQ